MARTMENLVKTQGDEPFIAAWCEVDCQDETQQAIGGYLWGILLDGRMRPIAEGTVRDLCKKNKIKNQKVVLCYIKNGSWNGTTSWGIGYPEGTIPPTLAASGTLSFRFTGVPDAFNYYKSLLAQEWVERDGVHYLYNQTRDMEPHGICWYLRKPLLPLIKAAVGQVYHPGITNAELISAVQNACVSYCRNQAGDQYTSLRAEFLGCTVDRMIERRS